MSHWKNSTSLYTNKDTKLMVQENKYWLSGWVMKHFFSKAIWNCEMTCEMQDIDKSSSMSNSIQVRLTQRIMSFGCIILIHATLNNGVIVWQEIDPFTCLNRKILFKIIENIQRFAIFYTSCDKKNTSNLTTRTCLYNVEL